MEALLAGADGADVSLVVLLGAPAYYGRFGFRPAEELGVISPEREWGEAFQVRPLTAHTGSVAGRFQYAPAFSSESLG
jgi:putative acetyltransferase